MIQGLLISNGASSPTFRKGRGHRINVPEAFRFISQKQPFTGLGNVEKINSTRDVFLWRTFHNNCSIKHLLVGAYDDVIIPYVHSAAHSVSIEVF